MEGPVSMGPSFFALVLHRKQSAVPYRIINSKISFTNLAAKAAVMP